MMRGKVLGVLHQVAVLDDGQGDAGDVGLLERVQADEMPADLPGDGHHGHAVHVGVGDGGDEVGRSRTGGGQAHAHLARGPGVAVGRMAGTLLVPDEDVVDVEIVEGVVEGDEHPSRKPEYGVDPFALQRFEDHSGCFHGALRCLFHTRLHGRPAAGPRAGPAVSGESPRPRGKGQEAETPSPSTAPVSAPDTKAT